MIKLNLVLMFLICLCAHAINVKSILEVKDVSHDLAFYKGALYIPVANQNKVYIYDFKKQVMLNPIITPSKYPMRVFAHDKYVSVISYYGNIVGLIDASTRKLRYKVNMGGYVNGGNEYVEYWYMGGCADQNNNYYYVSMTDVVLSTFNINNPRPRVIASQASVGLSGSVDLVCAENKLFVHNARNIMSTLDDEILVLTNTGKKLESIPVSGIRSMHNRGDYIFIVTKANQEYEHGRILVLDPVSHSIIAEVINENNPQMAAFDAVGNIYVVEKNKPGVSIYDSENYELLDRIEFPQDLAINNPRGIAVTLCGKTIFIESDKKISQISL